MSSLKSLGKIIEDKFKNKKVYIPLYQRNYKWTEEMAVKLAKDLLEQLKKDNNKDYNLGVLTLYKPNDYEIQILDGQQRMITLTLIVKALNEKNVNNNKWFELLFERDIDFEDTEDTTKTNPRYDYIYKIYKDVDSDGVDVSRMNSNFKKINDEISSANLDNKEEFYHYILKNVKFLYRETKSEPIEEFLNMNFNKTPFCSADHIKAYMVLDADANNQEITIAKVQELWKNLERVIFQIEDCTGIENEMFSLIKKNYNDEILNMNRIEILFYDRYLEEQDKGKNAIKTASRYHTKESALKDEYDRLLYYYDVMKSVLDEIAIVDKNGKRHPNYNALNAYNLLCKKNSTARFFEIIGLDENISKKSDVTEALGKHFNLTETSHNKINHIDNLNVQNQFLETMLSSQNNFEMENNNDKIENSISEKYYIKNNDKFKECYSSFKDCFIEYIELIEKGKKANSGIDKTLEDGKKTILELLENPNIEKIKIPSIQRDYVMGSSKEYLKTYLQHISFRYSWSCYWKFKENKIEDQYKELENILFKNNDTKKILELKEIKPGDGSRQNKYNKYKRSLNNPPDVTDFRKYGKDSDYDKFCQRVNELVKLNAEFNNKSAIDEKYYHEKFNTGCIMGYLDDGKTFWMYDGQQRLVTSIVLLALTRDKKNTELLKSLKKFSFEGRNGANKCLEILLDADNEITNKMRNYIEDKSSYSIYKLIENYKDLKENFTIKIDANYLLNGMEFEFAVVDKIDDVEQLFIEMNEGVKLTPEEQYKAEFNYTVNKILTDDKAKALLRKIDNEWLNFYKTEEKEVKMIKYCVKMACFEVKGYDSNLKDGSLQGLNQKIIDLVDEAMDKLVEAKDGYQIDIEEYSSKDKELWAYLVCCKNDKDWNEKDKADYMSKENRIYFEKDFVSFIKLYQTFALKKNGSDNDNIDCYTKCFEMIKEFRDNNRSLVVPNAPLKKDETNIDTENRAEEIYRQMLENRKDQFEFREISKWENACDDYEVVDKNKATSFSLSQIKPKTNVSILKITEDINICEYIDKLDDTRLISLCENIISNSPSTIRIEQDLVKKIVIGNEECLGLIFDDKKKVTNENEEYYWYANCRWSENDGRYENNDTQTDLSKVIIEEFKKGSLKTSIEVNAKIFNNCNKAKTIYNVLTGVWYVDKDKTSLCENTTENDINIKSISEINHKVFSCDKTDDVDELLYRYKYCDDKVKEYFEKYIAAYYFYKTIEGEDYQEKLYYIAKCYLKRRTDVRREYFNKYSEKSISVDIKQNILTLFLDEDFKDKDSDEYKDYCRQRGFSINSSNQKELVEKGELQ